MKLSSQWAEADRYNARGKTVEHCQVQVNVPDPGDSVYLNIDGEKRSFAFVLTIEAWRKLCKAIPEE